MRAYFAYIIAYMRGEEKKIAIKINFITIFCVKNLVET